MTLDGIPATEIARELGMTHVTVLKHSLSARQRLFADGITCGCGRIIAHSYWCSAKWDQYGRHRGRKPFRGGKDVEATKRLVAGEPVTSIASAMSLTVGGLGKLLRSLSDEQKRERAAAFQERLRRGTAALRDDLHARVVAAVPRYIDGSVRDDIIGELSLAVMEGRLEPEQIRAAVKSFVTRGLGEWQSHRSRSLDAPLSEEGGTLHELIGDASTVAQVGEISLGEAE